MIIAHTCHIFLHSSIDGHLVWFHCLAPVNSAAINIASLLYADLDSFSYLPRSGIAGSHGSSSFRVFFWGASILVSNLHSHQQCVRVPFSTYPHQHLLFIFLMIALLESQCPLISISFMTKDVEHFFMYLLAICSSSSENCLFN
jgi:hypothetical protein